MATPIPTAALMATTRCMPCMNACRAVPMTASPSWSGQLVCCGHRAAEGVPRFTCEVGLRELIPNFDRVFRPCLSLDEIFGPPRSKKLPSSRNRAPVHYERGCSASVRAEEASLTTVAARSRCGRWISRSTGHTDKTVFQTSRQVPEFHEDGHRPRACPSAGPTSGMGWVRSY